MLTVVALCLINAVDAPVTQVTVFTDQARVVRTAQVQVAGTLSVELPPLRDSIDPASVRVEAQGAEVRRVDIERLAPEKMRTDEAKGLIADLEKLDTEIARVNGERAVIFEQKAVLERLAPAVPVADPLKPAVKLNAGGWSASAQFTVEQLAKAHARLRDTELQLKNLGEKRDLLVDKAQKLGQPQTATGWQITAQLAGNGPATVTLTYLARQARWTPMWDLQLLPDVNQVSLSLAGLVSQDSGEDWNNTSLMLSTAIPSSAVKVPRLTTWKIGVVDRFIPTSTPISELIAPPPNAPGAPYVRSEEDVLRTQLSRVAGSAPTGYVEGVTAGGALAGKRAGDNRKAKDQIEYDDRLVQAERPAPAPPPPPPSRSYQNAPAAAPRAPAYEPEETDSVTVSATRGGFFKRDEAPPQPVAQFSLSPPPAWRAPSYGADSPVTLAGGYDLAFASLQKETIPTAKGTRRVALWSNQWPVQVERKIFPALAPEAYLVAELKNPSQQVLPGGPAQLYVGADPAGTARLKLVSPGEAFTLPLGLDRAIKAVRNVKIVDSTQGVVSKDDLSTYVVTIEIANPYRAPVSIRVYDQWPVTDQKDLEVKLVESKPLATQDALKGTLEWRTTIPPQQKATFTFSYSLKRPHGWKLQQQEVQP